MKGMTPFVFKMHTWNILLYMKMNMYKCIESGLEGYLQNSGYFWEGDWDYQVH